MFGEKRFGRRFDRPRPSDAAAGPAQGEPRASEPPGPRISRVVVPGEMLEQAPCAMPHAFTDGGKTFSAVMGLYDSAARKLVPLEGCYLPCLDDAVIGVVVYVKFSGYALDINSPYEGFLSSKETREEHKLGDVLVARVKDVDEVKNVDLTEASKLEKGELIEIPSVKVPRVIGKSSSMIRMIQDATKSEIVVGKNGRIWVKGGNTALAIAAILTIDREAHTHGLTDRINAFLKAGAA